MRPISVNVTAGPIVVPLNNNNQVFNVSIRTAGATTLEVCLERPDDSVPGSAYELPVGPAPTWFAAPAAVGGLTTLTSPVAAVRLTGVGTATILQQGLE